MFYFVIQFVVSFDPSNFGITLTVILDLPIIGPIVIGQVSGNLKNGISIKVGYPGVLSGEVGVKLEGNAVYLFYDFTAFGTHYKNQIHLFDI